MGEQRGMVDYKEVWLTIARIGVRMGMGSTCPRLVLSILVSNPPRIRLIHVYLKGLNLLFVLGYFVSYFEFY